MTSRKLVALLEIATASDRAAIREELRRRREGTEAISDSQTPPRQSADPTEAISDSQTPTRQSADPNEAISGGRRRVPMTDEEREALAEELRVNVGKKCQVIPYNTTEWVNGHIAGVINNKANNIVLYAIRTEDGRRIVKTTRSAGIRIFDEISELYSPCWRPRTKSAQERAKTVISDVDAVLSNVGRKVEFRKVRNMDNGDEVIEEFAGRIISLNYQKRSNRWLYYIRVPRPIDSDPNAYITIRKVIANPWLKIAKDIDAEGKAINSKYRKKYEATLARTSATPQERVVLCERNLAEAERRVQKAIEDRELKRRQLEEAQRELQKRLDELEQKSISQGEADGN